MTTPLNLEQILTTSQAFNLTAATPLQRAICRVADGRPIGKLALDETVIEAFGGVEAVASLPEERPAELYVLSGIRTGKSLLAAALAVRATQTVDVSGLGAGEVPRVSVISLRKDLADVVLDHLVGNLRARPALRSLMIGEPTSDSVLLRHPSGRPIEIKVVAGAEAGATLVARWSAGVILDEAPRMSGDEKVVNFSDARSVALGRLLPGAQFVAIGSPWAPRGPVYEIVQEHHGKPSRHVVVIRAQAPWMNPTWWTPERIHDLRMRDDRAYRVDVLAEFAEPDEGFFSVAELRNVTRPSPMELAPREGVRYACALDTAGASGNAWTLVMAEVTWPDGLAHYRVALAKQWKGTRSEPLDPEVVFAEISTICKRYDLRQALSDQWSAAAHVAIARRYALHLVIQSVNAHNRWQIYENLRALIASRRVELCPDPILRSDLLGVRRRLTTTGQTVVLPKTSDGRHCDYAPALALCVGVAAPEIARTIRFQSRLERARRAIHLVETGKTWEESCAEALDVTRLSVDESTALARLEEQRQRDDHARATADRQHYFSIVATANQLPADDPRRAQIHKSLEDHPWVVGHANSSWGAQQKDNQNG